MHYKTALPLAMLALAFSSLFAVSNANAECEASKVTGPKASGLTLKRAQQKARGKWERKVYRLHGYISNAWHDWGNAIEHKYWCDKVAGVHWCSATARPCTRTKRHAPRMICDSVFTRGGTGKATTNKGAKKKARGEWEKKTHADWGEAQNHRYDCRPKGKHRWYCNGIARRCRKA